MSKFAQRAVEVSNKLTCDALEAESIHSISIKNQMVRVAGRIENAISQVYPSVPYGALSNLVGAPSHFVHLVSLI